MNAPTIGLFGASGQVGRELGRTLAALGSVIVIGRDEVDLGAPATIAAVLDRLCPALIVNAAAYTRVDDAEADVALATAVNATAPGVMAAWAARAGVPMVHFSTDYVFDGRARLPYTEQSPTAPLSAYGRSKLAGDQAIMASGCSYLVFRTGWVYSNHAVNFLNTMRRLARERERLTVVADQVGRPTWARLIARECAAAVADCWRDGASGFGARGGIYNLTADGAPASWYDFACAIVASEAVRDPTRRWPEVLPITTAAYPTPATRPAYSVLATGRYAATFGRALPDWRTDLAACMGEAV